MTNEEAIAIIRNEYKCVDRDCDIERSCGKCDLMMPNKEPILEAYKLAIKALEQQPTDTWSIKKVADTFKKHGLIREQEPCDDAISRQAAINIVSLHCLTIDETVKAINSLPSVTQKSAKDYLDMADRKAKKIKDALTDNSQKYGKWILLDECANSGYYCSNCQKKLVKEGWSNTVKKIKYCPNCGAKMQESEEKNEM